MHLKAMIVGGITAVITAIFLQLFFPAILGFLFAVTLSGATLLDPLYADYRLGTVWGAFGQMLALQTIQALLTAVLAGVTAGEIGVRWASCLGSLIAGTVSSLIHAILLFIFVGIYSLFISEAVNGLAQTYAFFMALAMGFIIGMISSAAARKWGMGEKASEE